MADDKEEIKTDGFTLDRVVDLASEGDWSESPIYITDSFGRPQTVRRVSFQINADGSRIILFHDPAAAVS
jgi:hypothetical protein